MRRVLGHEKGPGGMRRVPGPRRGPWAKEKSLGQRRGPWAKEEVPRLYQVGYYPGLYQVGTTLPYTTPRVHHAAQCRPEPVHGSLASLRRFRANPGTFRSDS